MRVVVETYYDNELNEIGELVFESDELSFRISQYGNSFDKDGRRIVAKVKYFNTEGGALRELLRMELKASKAATIEALLEGLDSIHKAILEKTAIVVAAREQKAKRAKPKPKEALEVVT